MDFEREERYVVIKGTDANQLNRIEQKALQQILESVNTIRKARGKGELECVCVESDWPEYDTVWGMIEARVTGEVVEAPALELLKKVLVAWDALPAGTHSPLMVQHWILDDLAPAIREVKDFVKDK